MAKFQDVDYRQNSENPANFFYTPGRPSPELTAAGVPAAMLVGTGDGGFFQLGVHWAVSQNQLQDLAQYIRKQFPDLASAPILSPDSVTVDDVKLVLQMPDRSSSVLATASSAAYPPFTALFNVTLDAARFAQTSMALSGREDVLKVQYDISGQSLVSCTATIAGDAQPDVQALDPGADTAACLSQIESAIADGRIQLTVAGDEVSPELRDKTISTAKEHAARVLQRMLSGTDSDLDAAHLLASVTLSDTKPVKLLREADVGRWFSGGNSVKLAVAAVPAGSPGDTINCTFKLGFDLQDLPIAFVQIASGSLKDVLRPPAFSPITLKLNPGKPVTITTKYTDGGQPYEIQISAANEMSLSPQQLGCCLVTVDGSGRKQNGAKQLKMRVKYHPTGNGTEDEHTINWQYGDWTDSWYFISRESGLGGVIEYSWQETASDGTVVDHPPLKTSQTQLKL